MIREKYNREVATIHGYHRKFLHSHDGDFGEIAALENRSFDSLATYHIALGYI